MLEVRHRVVFLLAGEQAGPIFCFYPHFGVLLNERKELVDLFALGCELSQHLIQILFVWQFGIVFAVVEDPALCLSDPFGEKLLNVAQ